MLNSVRGSIGICIGKELLEDPMNRKILQIHDMIGETRSITLFSKPSFVKTIKESADQLMAFCSEMNCDGERIYMSLKENGFKLETKSICLDLLL